MAEQSLARNFFDRALVGGAEFLQGLVTNAQTETEWLDFKGAENISDMDTKNTWCEALSGFANNQGGVLIWGIDARRDKVTQIDAACALSLAPSPENLRDRLRELRRDATDPPLLGVVMEAVFDSGTSGPGYVICYVPEGNIKPHRAELLPNKPYMLRIGDSFRNPSPAILRNLFFPGSAAWLRLLIVPEWEAIKIPTERSPPFEIEIRYRMSLHNAGAVSAKEIFVIIETRPANLTIDGAYPARRTETEFGLGFEYEKTLHPSSSASFGIIRQSVGAGHRASKGTMALYPETDFLEVNVNIFATDMVPQKLRVHFTDREIDEKRRKWAEPVLPEANA